MRLPPRTPQQVIKELSDSRIESLIQPAFSDIDTLASYLSIDEGYLSAQVRLLIPQFEESELSSKSGVDTVRTVLRILRTALSDFEKYYGDHRARNGIDSLELGLHVKGRKTNLRLEGGAGAAPLIRFDGVDPRDGFEIQDQIHYIHNRREDTLYHRGLFLEDLEFPLCYCAISRCDREYQASALSAALDVPVPLERVAVMTRAYGYSPLPKNMMSKLFDLTARELTATGEFDFLITALNPFLGFTGSIFLGASFEPFARSPLVYHFSESGLYVNRRKASDKRPQKYKTPPIVWLVRQLHGGAPGPWHGKIVDIDPEQYASK